MEEKREQIGKIWKISVLVIITLKETPSSCDLKKVREKRYGKIKCFKWPYLYL